jgi:hypothetical protein
MHTIGHQETFMKQALNLFGFALTISTLMISFAPRALAKQIDTSNKASIKCALANTPDHRLVVDFTPAASKPSAKGRKAI